jgi:hypothetical protein
LNESKVKVMKGRLAIFILASVGIVACKSSKDVAAEPPAEEPIVEVADTIRPDPVAEEALADTAAAASDAESTAEAGPSLETPGADQGASTDEGGQNQADPGSGFRVQLESVIGNPNKAKYKGIKDLSFEKGSDGRTRIFLGKDMVRTAAEQLRDEYKLRGFEDAFVVSGNSAGSAEIFDASLSSQSLGNAQGLVYLIQLSAFQGEAESRALKKLGWYQVLAFDDGWKRVYSGAYSALPAAQDAMNKYRRRGFKDCYIVPFDGYTNKLNGKTGKVVLTSQK